MKIRKPELEQYRKIWLRKDSYEYLKEQKKIQKKSMARILDNIINYYKDK